MAVAGNRGASKKSAAVIESLECRRLATVTSWTDNDFTQFTSAFFGGVAWGDNGMPWGAPTAQAGANDVPDDYLIDQWGEYSESGIETGWMDVDLKLNTSGSGGMTWSVNGQTISLNYSAPSSVSAATIQAAVAYGGMAIKWQNLQVDFYSGGTRMEIVTATGPVADETGTPSSTTPFESIVSITPTASGIDGVEVKGQIKMIVAAGVYPGPTDIFSQVVIN